MNLKGLNDRQREAVTSTEGRIRVVAGAGSGKTRTLAYRYAFIVNELGVDPASMLCLTFTNKAAQEMKSRIAQLVPPGYTNDFVCTIHGFCVRFLREEIFRIGYPRNFQILDEEDMKTLAKQVLTDNNSERSVKTVRTLLDKLAGYKANNPYIQKHIISATAFDDKLALPQHVQLILKQKDKLALDFDDILAFTLHILEAFPDVCGKWQERMTYVMVDETQDCNASDWKLVETLSKLCGNLFVVGDPDQSIYEWRGAKPGMFMGFRCDKTIVLDENYRSTPGILNVANSIIANNRERLDKTMFTRREAGESIIHFHAPNETQEAAWVCGEIGKRMEMGAGFADFAILFRASHLSRFMEQTLIRAGIPYVMWGGVRFFERLEVKDCISYLRLIASDDDLAFERVINTPSRKVGKATLERITELAQRGNCSMYQALKNGISDGVLARPALEEFVSLIEDCRLRRNSLPVSVLMSYILEKTGLKSEYRDDNDEQRLENITELLNSMRMWEAEMGDEDMPLDAYLQDISLYTNADYRKNDDKVKLMTVHQAKGLEFPYVFIIGLSEGIFPNARSIRERKKSALEEERRLMYVAATRAEKCLYMTESEGYNMQTQQDKLPSRFIAEISRDLFVTEGEMDESLWRRIRTQVALEVLEEDDYPTESSSESEIRVGKLVEHSVFGRGVVEEITENGSCKVRFDKGVRYLRKDILRLCNTINIPITSSNNLAN